MKFDEENYRKCNEFSTVTAMYDSYSQDNKIINSLLATRVDLASFYNEYNNLFSKTFAVASANAFEKK